MRLALHSLQLFSVFVIAVASDAPLQCRDVDCCFLRPGAPKNTDHRRFDSAVGLGYDALTATIACPIYSNSYDRCRSTGDNQFLIPDYVTAVPVLETHLSMSADYFKSYQEVADSHSMGASAGLGFSYMGAGVSASFSYKSQSTKKHMSDQQSSLMRSSLHHHGYDVLLDTKAPFHESFEKRLDDIAKALSKNLTSRAAYMAELLIRDCGTHVITSAAMSAVIEQDIFITSSTIGDNETTEREVKAAVAASFGSTFSASASFSYQKSDSSSALEKVSQGTTHTELRTIGGPDIKKLSASNFSNPYLVDNLRPIPKGGLPIGDIIMQMPNRTFKDVAGVRDAVQRATHRYFTENHIHGCTTEGPGYNYMANVADDDACISDDPNATHFGGTYTAFDITHKFADILSDDDFVATVAPVNFKTGARNCPDGFDADLLWEGDAMHWRTDSLCQKNCKFNAESDLTTCCDFFTISIMRFNIKTYWCRPNSSGVKPKSGLFFGGLIRGEQGQNHYSGGNGCPSTFVASRFLGDLFVCVGDPEGAKAELTVGLDSLYSALSSKQSCETGFSPYTVTTEDAEITACVRVVKANAAPPVLKSLPYTNASLANQEYAVSTISSYVGNRLVATAVFQDVWDHYSRTEGHSLEAMENMTTKDALERIHPFYSQHRNEYFACLNGANMTANCQNKAPEWLIPAAEFA